ncbi:MAG TPA: hypothetical protein VIK29_11335 [Paludibacter sp.]
MDYKTYIPGAVCILFALVIMFRLLHYAPFYAPSYFFWIGAILVLVGIISLVKPLAFLFVFDRKIAMIVCCGGILMSILSIYWPVSVHHSQTNLKLDALLPDYSFNEYHDIRINASPEEVKHALQTTGVGDIPAVHLLLKIRGIGDKDLNHKVADNKPAQKTFSTPDFNFFIADSTEFISVMILRASAKTPPPEVTTAEQFMAFNEPGYVKVAFNFRFISLDNGQTQVSTETRNYAMTNEDGRIFGRYWRIIYPGSAIIRRLWLDTLAEKAEKGHRQ